MNTTSSNKAMLIDGKQAYASGGAVAQDGSLKVYYCGKCGRRIVWATSARTGGKYLVNVFDKNSGGMHYVKNQLHTCEQEIKETTATAEEINVIAAKARRYAIMDSMTSEEAHLYRELRKQSADDALVFLNSVAINNNLPQAEAQAKEGQ